MIFRRILDAVERLEKKQDEAVKALEALRKQVDELESPAGPLDDARMQQGIANLRSFDGKPRRREG